MNQFENESCRDALEKRNKDLKKQFEGNEVTVSNLLALSTPPGYTFHDGKKHVAMVEQYVGRLLGEKRIAKLTDDELFVLLMGVLCHDVGMTKYKTDGENYIPDRENHNIASYLEVYDPSKNTRGTLEINVPSRSSKYFKAIALLCLGHRDHKDENKQKIRTLTECFKILGRDTRIPETITISNNNKIHVQYLSAILRLADEIDVTNQRAPRDVEMHLRTFITELAKKHWCTHNLIEEVGIQSNNGTTNIILIPDIDEILARSNDPIDGMAQELLICLLFERLEKIKEEISIINQITTSSAYFSTGLSVEYKVDLQYDDVVVTKEKYNDYLNKVKEEEKKKKSKEGQSGADFDDSKGIARIPKKTPRERFNEEIQRLKVDQNLLEIGNFEFPFGEYSHYFINTQLLLTNRDTLNAITDIFRDHYSTTDIDCVIGIGKAGIVIAPNLSLKLNCNCSYLIGGWEATVPWEESTSVIETAKNMLVILDVISTGTVTRQFLEIIRNKNKNCLENIYIGTVFCTNEAIKDTIVKDDGVKELFSINNDFQFKTFSLGEPLSDENLKSLKKEFELLPPRKK